MCHLARGLRKYLEKSRSGASDGVGVASCQSVQHTPYTCCTTHRWPGSARRNRSTTCASLASTTCSSATTATHGWGETGAPCSSPASSPPHREEACMSKLEAGREAHNWRGWGHARDADAGGTSDACVTPHGNPRQHRINTPYQHPLSTPSVQSPTNGSPYKTTKQERLDCEGNPLIETRLV